LTVYINNEEKELAQTLILIRSNFAYYMFQKNKKIELPEVLEIKRNKIKQSILDLINSFS